MTQPGDGTVKIWGGLFALRFIGLLCALWSHVERGVPCEFPGQLGWFFSLLGSHSLLWMSWTTVAPRRLWALVALSSRVPHAKGFVALPYVCAMPYMRATPYMCALSGATGHLTTLPVPWAVSI